MTTGRPVLGPDRIAELEDERAFLLLEDLDRGAGDLDADDERELRDAYTARLAAVLKEVAGQEASRPPRPPRRAGRIAAIVGGSWWWPSELASPSPPCRVSGFLAPR